MNGILLVDKPSGWTSFDVVAKVRGLLRQAVSSELRVRSEAQNRITQNSKLKTSSPKVKVGHTGTLDPLATGLLVLVLGDYCKRASEFSKLDKVYEVTMKLGETSTTGDEEGDKTAVSSKQIAESELKAALNKFTGEIMQTPPAYSAVKVNGQRAYKLARAGKEVVIEPRQVKVYSLQMTDFNYPEAKFVAKVSSGTYIRTLVEDIGKALGTGAYMSALRRTQVGNFAIEKSVPVEMLNAELIKSNMQLV